MKILRENSAYIPFHNPMHLTTKKKRLLTPTGDVITLEEIKKPLEESKSIKKSGKLRNLKLFPECAI